jgi:signal transduction histidine kinase
MAGELMSAELSEPPGDLAAQFAKCDCKALIEAIWHSQHHLALHDPEERLLAWSAAYEAYHQQVFDALRAEGRVAEVRFPEFARRSLIGKTPPERIADEAAARVAAHRDPDGISIDRHIPGVGWWRLTKSRLPTGAVLTVGVDITAIKESEIALDQALRAAQAADAAKTAFLSQMSHEFRTPLNGVLGMAALLRNTGLDARQSAMLDVLAESAGSLLGVVEDVVEFAAAQGSGLVLQHGPFSPARALRAEVDAMAAQPVSARARIVLSSDDAATRTVIGDADRFRRVFRTLLGKRDKVFGLRAHRGEPHGAARARASASCRGRRG